jgi:acetyltransferase-like isoleucine patch superfamily enzyme
MKILKKRSVLGANTIYANVALGKDCVLEPPVIIGKPPRGKEDGEIETVLGHGSVIRPFTTIYAGARIGSGFQTGHGALIREGNIIGNNCSVGTNAVLEFDNKIGNFVRVHSGAFLEMVTVEDYVFIGPNVVFTDDPHPMGCPKFRDCVKGATVKEFARIGANSTILPGVVIGKNSLVGAGSVVVKDVGEGLVVAGVPAKVVGKVSELKCRMGFFDRVYGWEPYEKRGK